MEKEGVWMALPIAIVEDQTPDAQRLEELLQQQLPEAECTWFACGDDFLRAAAEPGLYAVVFLDICMAGTNGIETARRLRQADPEVLIVFVTYSPEYVWDAFPVHPFDYLLKPYQKEKFEHLAAEQRRPLQRGFSTKGGAVLFFRLLRAFLCGFQFIHPLLQGGDLIVHFQKCPDQNSQHQRGRNDHPQGLLTPEQQRIAAEYNKNEYGKQACNQHSKKSHTESLLSVILPFLPHPGPARC